MSVALPRSRGHLLSSIAPCIVPLPSDAGARETPYVTPTRWPAIVYAIVVVLVLCWNVLHAGRAVQLRRGSAFMRWLTALCGLLLVPALTIAVTSASAINGRTTHVVAWVWPMTAALFVLQSVRAVSEGSARLSIGLPVLAFNLTVGASALVRFANGAGVTLPATIGALGVAEATSLGFVFGHAALVSPWALSVPVLTPVIPARRRSGRAVKAGIAVMATVAALLYAAEYPRGVRALETFQPFSAERLQERPRGDFALGVRVLPEIVAPPPPLALRYDLALVDTLNASVVEVFVTPSGTRGTVLDSVARALEDIRRDSTLLVVSLGYDPGDRRLMLRNPEGYATLRLRAIDRVVRRLRPDLLIPARDPADAGMRALGSVALSWWTRFFSAAADLAHELRPRTRVGLAASAYTPFDSALFAWASGPQSPLDVAGFTLLPSYGGGASLAARLRVAGQWSRSGQRPLWVFAVGLNPRVFGVAAQERATWGVLAWATSQPRMRGLIVDGAGDYDELVGMRAPGGRLRDIVTTFERAERVLAEAASGQP